MKRLFLVFNLVGLIVLCAGCSAFEKQDFSNILMPIKTVSAQDGTANSDTDIFTAEDIMEELGKYTSPDEENEPNEVKTEPETPSDEAGNINSEDKTPTDIPDETVSAETQKALDESSENPIKDENASDETEQTANTDEAIIGDIQGTAVTDTDGSVIILKNVADMTDEEFAELAPTTRMSFEELVGDNGVYNGYPEFFPYPDTYKIVVDLTYELVMIYRKDINGDYVIPVRYMKCSSGGSGNDTPDGTFKMRDYRVRFALFRNTNSYAQYWSLITGKIYFHSILYDKLDASTYSTTAYNNLGKKCSHGCIRLTVPDARWIWYNIAPETVCEIKYGTKEDTETIAIRDRLQLVPLPETRVKLKKGEIPQTDNWTIEDVPREVPFVNGSQD